MNRRSFIKWATTLTAGIIATARLPLSLIPQSIREISATNYLTKIYSRWKASGQDDGRPIYMVATPDLHDTFWKEQEHRSIWTNHKEDGKRIELFRLPEKRKYLKNQYYDITKQPLDKVDDETQADVWWADIYQGYFPVY